MYHKIRVSELLWVAGDFTRPESKNSCTFTHLNAILSIWRSHDFTNHIWDVLKWPYLNIPYLHTPTVGSLKGCCVDAVIIDNSSDETDNLSSLRCCFEACWIESLERSVHGELVCGTYGDIFLSIATMTSMQLIQIRNCYAGFFCGKHWYRFFCGKRRTPASIQ